MSASTSLTAAHLQAGRTTRRLADLTVRNDSARPIEAGRRQYLRYRRRLDGLPSRIGRLAVWVLFREPTHFKGYCSQHHVETNVVGLEGLRLRIHL